MGNFPSRGPRDQNAPRQFFDATCSSCGEPCQVPFKPTPGKNVYCRSCFQQQPKRQF